ncbi:hypothetical protein RBRAMI_3022 [Pseudomonas aeruginosa RB]|nr:Uncharacterized protein PAKB6_2852 [Pseudomonas aeruginosa]GAJ54134.1 hypothetical protein RBRAMI_3022 [Pseudomonas aeruginosa RB]
MLCLVSMAFSIDQIDVVGFGSTTWPAARGKSRPGVPGV